MTDKDIKIVQGLLRSSWLRKKKKKAYVTDGYSTPDERRREKILGL